MSGPFSRRNPAERVAYVEGYAEGWKDAVNVLVSAGVLPDAAKAILDEALGSNLDMFSNLENLLRARAAREAVS